jgi:large subunit ribosomal protein L10
VLKIINIDKKKEIVLNIKKNIENAKSIILLNACGMNVVDDTELRKKLRAENVIYKVYKNNILRFAFRETRFSELEKYLVGPTSIAISNNDSTLVTRIINNEIKNGIKIIFKAGIIDNNFYDSESIIVIANIESREKLLAKLLNSFKSPMASFARIINKISEKKNHDI